MSSDKIVRKKRTAKLAQAIEDKYYLAETTRDREADGMTVVGRQKFVDSMTDPHGARHKLYKSAQQYTTPRDRAMFMADLIADGRWRTPMSRGFADAWKVSYGTVSQYLGRARDVVAASLGDKESLRMNALAFADRIAHDAADSGDNRSAVAALRTFAEIGGLIQHKHEITGADGGPIQLLAAVKHLSDAELDAEIARAGARRAQRAAEDEGRDMTAAECALLEVAALPPVAPEPPDAELVEDGD